MTDPYTEQAKIIAALSAANGLLRAEVERLQATIAMLIDNHDHGSYESEGQAFDKARADLEPKPNSL
jgi:hypothetical protein